MGISLQKGQRVSLDKPGGGQLTKVTMGLGWDAVKKKGLFGSREQSIDLDASAVMFDANKSAVDTIWFRQLRSRCGNIIHTGDNRTGDGDGDDEQIICDLGGIPSNVESIIFVVNSFTGQNFSQIENAFCRIVDNDSGNELARYELSCQGSHNAQVMTKVYRHNGGWKIHAIGENGNGRTFQELMPQIIPHV